MFPTDGAACGGVFNGGAAILFSPHHLLASLEPQAYLPLIVLPLMILFVVWRLHHNEVSRLETELSEARANTGTRERERDLAQEELFRRL